MGLGFRRPARLRGRRVDWVATMSELADASAFAATLVDGLDVAVIAVDASGQRPLVNAAARRLLALPEDGLISYEQLLTSAAMLHPDTGEEIPAEELPLRRALAGTDNETEIILARSGVAGPRRRLVVRARGLRRPDGSLLGAVLVAQDVTDLHNRNRILARHAAQLTAIGEATRAVLRDADSRGTVCQSACTVSGAALATLFEPDGLGHLVCTAASGADVLGIRIPVNARSITAGTFLSGTTRVVSDVDQAPDRHNPTLERMSRACGQTLTSGAFIPVVTRGRTVGVLAVGFAGLTSELSGQIPVLEILAAETAVAIERQDLLRCLEAEAGSDGLTGAGNRRAWDEELARALARAARDGLPLAVILLDFDHFKAFNDTHGHLAGDALLRELVAAWRNRVRPADVLCRYGGEEFTVLLPDCTLDGALRVAEHLRALVPSGQTCSAGIAGWDLRESGETLLSRADGALYLAKTSGRNQARVAETPSRDDPPLPAASAS